MISRLHTDDDPEFELLLRLACADLIEQPTDEQREVLTADLECQE